MFVEREVVFGEIGGKEVESKLMIMDGNSSKDKTDAAHFLL